MNIQENQSAAARPIEENRNIENSVKPEKQKKVIIFYNLNYKKALKDKPKWA